jgi:hypothetical protein
LVARSGVCAVFLDRRGIGSLRCTQGWAILIDDACHAAPSQ